VLQEGLGLMVIHFFSPSVYGQQTGLSSYGRTIAFWANEEALEDKL
jgi:hypothetical protein